MINFVGFQKMVEALGRVDMHRRRVESVHYARSGKYMGEDICQGPAASAAAAGTCSRGRR
jgi:hypothetical protein